MVDCARIAVGDSYSCVEVVCNMDSVVDTYFCAGVVCDGAALGESYAVIVWDGVPVPVTYFFVGVGREYVVCAVVDVFSSVGVVAASDWVVISVVFLAGFNVAIVGRIFMAIVTGRRKGLVIKELSIPIGVLASTACSEGRCTYIVEGTNGEGRMANLVGVNSTLGRVVIHEVTAGAVRPGGLW